MNEEPKQTPTKAEELWRKCLSYLEWQKTIKPNDVQDDGTDPISLITSALTESRKEGFEQARLQYLEGRLKE